jgi:hypothetical protein
MLRKLEKKRIGIYVQILYLSTVSTVRFCGSANFVTYWATKQKLFTYSDICKVYFILIEQAHTFPTYLLDFLLVGSIKFS